MFPCLLCMAHAAYPSIAIKVDRVGDLTGVPKLLFVAAALGRPRTEDSGKGWHSASDQAYCIVDSGVTTGTFLWANKLSGLRLGSSSRQTTN